MFFAKGYRVTRLWNVEEEGTFPTLERSSQGSALKKTLPRIFGPADPNFTECRGVVLANKQTGEKVRTMTFTNSETKLYTRTYIAIHEAQTIVDVLNTQELQLKVNAIRR